MYTFSDFKNRDGTTMNTTKQNDDRPIDILLLAAGFLVLLLFGIRTISSADIWFHLAAGRNVFTQGVASVDPFSFGLSPGTAWQQTSWLYDVVMFRLWDLGGSVLIILVHTLTVVGSFYLLIPACRRFSGDIHRGIALLVCAWILAPVFTPRPQLFCLFFAAVQLNILSRQRLTLTNGLFLAVTQMAWANVHVSFVIGLILVVIRGWEVNSLKKHTKSFSFPSESPVSHYAALLFVLASVSCINPAGIRIYHEAFAMMTRPEGGIMLEWISTFYRDFLPYPTSFVTTVALIMIASVFIFHRDRLPAMFTFTAVISAFMMVRSNQGMEFCALFAFPFVCMSAASLTQLTSKISSLPARLWLSRTGYAVVTFLMIYSGWLIMTNRYYIHSGSASAFGLQVSTDAFPVGAMTFVRKEHAFPARMLNIAHDGGYLLWTNPNQKVFTDSRGNLYGGPFYERLAKGMLGNQIHWKDLLTRYDPEGILLNATWTGAGTVAFHLVSRGQWVIAYFDGTSMLLIRKTSSNQALMDDKEMQGFGLALIDQSYDRYRSHLKNKILRPPNPSRLIGAASILQALGRYDESLKLLVVLTEGSPRNIAAWVNRGIAEFNLSKNSDAIASLEHAIQMVPGNPLTLLWLSEAYDEAGRKSDAVIARQKAGKINATIVDRFKKDREAMLFNAPPQ